MLKNPWLLGVSAASRRSSLIDLLRTLAIVAVLAVHLGAAGVTGSSANALSAFFWEQFVATGNNGVLLFFTLSGFLITRILAVRNESLFKINRRDFYTRRVARLLPLLLTILVLGLVVLRVGSWSEALQFCFANRPLDLSFWLSLPTFAFNWLRIALTQGGLTYGAHWDVLWSLAIEEQFYLLYPLLLGWSRTPRRLGIVLAALVVLGPLARGICYLLDRNHLYLGVMNSFGCFDLMAMGCLAYLLRAQVDKRLPPTGRAWLAFTGAILTLSVFVPFLPLQRIWGPSLIGGGVFMILVSGVELTGRFWGWFMLPGRLSYGLYLIHSFVLFCLWPFLGGIEPIQGLVLYVAATTALGWVCSRFLEEPANRWVLHRLLP